MQVFSTAKIKFFVEITIRFKKFQYWTKKIIKEKPIKINKISEKYKNN